MWLTLVLTGIVGKSQFVIRLYFSILFNFKCCNKETVIFVESFYKINNLFNQPNNPYVFFVSVINLNLTLLYLL